MASLKDVPRSTHAACCQGPILPLHRLSCQSSHAPDFSIKTTMPVQVPEFRVSYTITTDAFDALYKRLKPKGVTLTALLAKAAGVALASHPLLYACALPSCTGALAWSSGCLVLQAEASQ